MKSKTVAPRKNEPEKVAYILAQGSLRQKTRPSGRPARQKTHSGSGYLLVGMYESLAKTFTTHKAATDYAKDHGFKVKLNRKVA